MNRDITLLFLAVPVSLLGGLVALWLMLQMMDTTGAELLVYVFAGLIGVFGIGAVSCGIIGIAELLDSD
jgi:hypothetical protein